MRKYLRVFPVFIIAAAIAGGCNFPKADSTSGLSDANLVSTFSAQTVIAYGTSLAEEAAQTPTPSNSTNTPETIYTATMQPTNTKTPELDTTADVACDSLQFVKDITVDDGTTFAPGETFTKTWRIENVGSCTWDSSYSLVFANDGNAMGGNASQQLTTGTVAPGDTIDLSIELTAPTKSGTYRGNWALRNGSGAMFGEGTSNKPFYVEIEVERETYNFVDKYCKADWSSDAGDLDCPGETDDAEGFVVRVDNPDFGDRSEDETALWLNPQAEDDGEIRGVFPAITVSQGSSFMGYLGCQEGAEDCDIMFQLNYIADNGSEKTLDKWHATYDSFIDLETDLSSLAGKSVEFILIVKANGEMNEDEALLMQARIE